MRISPLEQTARVMASPRLLVFGELPAIEPSTLPYRLVYDPEAEFDAIFVGEDGSSKDAVAAAELRPLAPVAGLANPPCACAELRLGSPGLPRRQYRRGADGPSFRLCADGAGARL
ncbi:MAG TPA: hypothetical protein VLR47_04035, partial [Rhodospirillales bacterium]|nr:hypothetical protein [Rhodospirillales bacterium]